MVIILPKNSPTSFSWMLISALFFSKSFKNIKQSEENFTKFKGNGRNTAFLREIPGNPKFVSPPPSLVEMGNTYRKLSNAFSNTI